MAAVKLLFSTWTGVLSVFTVLFAIGMIAYIVRVMARLSKGDPQ